MNSLVHNNADVQPLVEYPRNPISLISLINTRSGAMS